MITQLLTQAGDWTWIILGLILLGLELLMPGTFFMWLGLAALGVGFVALLVDLSWQVELALFGLLAVLFVLAGRRFFARHGDETTDAPGLNERASVYLGRQITLDEPLVGGAGRVKLGDTMWRIEGPDVPAGTRVEVKSARGATLQVEKI